MKEQDIIELDGSQGEGGGQVLRTALTLAMITGRPFRIEHIRAKRSKPGLLRQHLTAVQAAAAVSSAQVDGAAVGSQTLRFAPGPIRGGDYRLAIGTAGSCTLVLQTVLPALWFADAPSTVTVSGGTHNKAAPPADFLIRAWQPLVRRMGAKLDITLRRHGFYPAGGGEVVASTEPCGLQAITLIDRGERQALKAEALVAAVPGSVARRELERAGAQLACLGGRVRELPAGEGPGNALLIEVAHAQVTELFTSFGERGVSAEAVADHAARQARLYLESGAAVGEYLADQLLLPLALAGGGAFTTVSASSHLLTNIAVIEKFLPVEIAASAQADGRWLVEIG
ncbi:RNA 3'-terminal phosphate cyclase [Chitinimonas koreensis]|uniref:RNA 3'-terminal phosphate cyclase n=1 Tax=Chitinimonas koreensis TaxID=356302 RepID=UPI00042306B7|nr:RNA 3'-terminal phosphate cyclase [Chitinimonas koreensis]QNM97751.1 RNA 3'-terminal phosphate cyclase [Chitinimonas koreensis]